MALHTERFLVFPPHQGIDANWHVTDSSDTCVAHCFGFAHDIQGGEPLARRIAAALNACRGASTEAIEAMLGNQFDDARSQRKLEAEQVRDELLAELITCRHDLARMLGELRQSVTVPDTGAIPDQDDEALCLFEEARIERLDALIAKAKGAPRS